MTVLSHYNAQQNAAQNYPGAIQNIPEKPKESDQLLRRLDRLKDQFSEILASARTSIDPIVGLVPESLERSPSVDVPQSHFLLALERSVGELEMLAANIDNQIARLRQAF